MGDRLSCLQRGVSRPSAFRQNREMGVGLDLTLHSSKCRLTFCKMIAFT